MIDYRWGKVTGDQPCLPRTKASALSGLSNRSHSKRAVSRDDMSRDQVSINYTRPRGRSSRGLSEEGLAPRPGLCGTRRAEGGHYVFVARGDFPLEGLRLILGRFGHGEVTN